MSLVRVDTVTLSLLAGESKDDIAGGSIGEAAKTLGNEGSGYGLEVVIARSHLLASNSNLKGLNSIDTSMNVHSKLMGTQSGYLKIFKRAVSSIIATSITADNSAAEQLTSIIQNVYEQAEVLGYEATSNMQADKFANYSGVLDLAVGIRNGEFSVDEYIKYAGSNDKVNDVSTVLNSYLDSLSADEQEKLFGDMSRQEWVNSKIDEAMTINQDFNNAGHSSDAYDKAKSRGLTINETRNPDWFDNPVALTKSMGVNQGPSGKETYYNLKMSGVVDIMRDMGFSEEEYPYWVREDGVKMLGDYVMVAADLDKRPRGTLVESSLGMAIVCDTGGFVNSNPWQLDIAVTW